MVTLNHKFDKIKGALPYLWLGLGLLLFFVWLSTYAPTRVGDGGEYYALYLAWDTTARPWMTPAAYEAYDEIEAFPEIKSLVPRVWLQNLFPALRIGETGDFNHFWFYSLLAFLAGRPVSLLGVQLHIHTSFLLLHFLLFFMTVSISYRFYKWRGVGIVLLMALVSPMLWYFDKVHTEFFTFCLVLSAVMLIGAQKYLLSALCLALASTQNISFALAAVVPVVYRLWFQREQLYSALEVITALATVLAVLAHPLYYFSRYGVFDPQLLAGGASIGLNASSFYIWLLDPDLGLLPNWPLGSLALILVIGLWIFQKGQAAETIDTGRWTVFLLIYLATNLYANSSTTNLNHGATPGLARYALWYLPLAFPYFHRIAIMVSARPRNLAILGSIILVLAYYSLRQNDPRLPERCCNPSYLSRLIQTRMSWAYDPPVEVFMERYSGYSESVHAHHLNGVVGPDCRKILLLPGDDRQDATWPGQCHFDPGKLNAFINAQNAQNPHRRYIRLSDQQAQDLAAGN